MVSWHPAGSFDSQLHGLGSGMALFGGGGNAGFGGTGTPFCADEAHAAARNTHGRRTRAKGGEALLLGQL
jgi:hypothetical protein